MLLNGLLLFFVVLTPFTTMLVSAHLLRSDANIAAAIYSGSFFLLSIAWNLTWYAASHFHNLIDEDVPKSQIKRVTREYAVAPIANGLAVPVAFVSPIASVVVILAVGVYFGITVTGGEKALEHAHTN
jgi:uncharacterized membrane protein